MNKEDCIFCKIATKNIPVVLTENKNAVMFMDAHPIAPVHYLITPKDHFDNMTELLSYDGGALVLADMYDLIHEFLWENKVAFDFNLIETGYRLIINSGLNAGQSVKHMHMHLLGGTDFGQPYGVTDDDDGGMGTFPK